MMLAACCACLCCGWISERRALKKDVLAAQVWAVNRDDRIAAINDVSRLGAGRDCAPYLIFALGDPDLVVGNSADGALRRISGKERGVGDFQSASDRERLKMMTKWVEWYLVGDTKSPN